MSEPPDHPGPSSLHVITGLWRHTGGPAETVPALCGGLVRAGAPVTLATLAGDLADPVRTAAAAGVDVRTFPASVRHTMWYSRSLHAALPDLVADHDLVHAHAMWQAPGWLACEEAVRRGKPLVISPRGSLLPRRLAKSRLKKRLASLLFDGRNVRRCSLMHATSDEEAGSIRTFGYRGPIAVIPNGIEVPDDSTLRLAAGRCAALHRRYPETAGRRLLLFLSRIEPIKGVTSLAKAWGRLAAGHPEWHLVIAGPAERNHDHEVCEILDSSGVLHRTTLAGPLYGDDREAAFAACEVFVLPTTSENFGMVIGEALARGRPVITTLGAPWPGIVDHDCGWRIPLGDGCLVECLDGAMSTPPSTLRAMGDRGRGWMQRDFSWPSICGRMRGAYDWTLGRVAATPPDVRIT